MLPRCGIWDWRTPKLLQNYRSEREHERGQPSQKPVFAPSGKSVFTQDGRVLTQWDVGGNAIHRKLHLSQLNNEDQFAFSPDCTRLVTVNRFSPALKIWDSSLLFDEALGEAINPLLLWNASITERDDLLTIRVPLRGRRSARPSPRSRSCHAQPTWY